ncbi:MAG: hypothetical protein R3Y13_04925 [bacterium]
MKDKIYDLIDSILSLVKTSEIKDIEDYKNKLVKKLDDKRELYIKLTSLLESDRYYDKETEELDKNTVQALQKKIKKLQTDEFVIKEEIKKIQEEEKVASEKILLGIENVDKYKELLKNISYKLVDNSLAFEYYNELNDNNVSKLDYWNNYLKKAEKDKEEKNNQILILRTNKDQFEYEIKNLRTRIEEINHDLENKFNYINQNLKEKDEKEYTILDREIVKLEKELNQILNSSEYIIHELRVLVKEENYIYAQSKLKELIAKIEFVPYVLDNNYEELELCLKNIKKEKIRLTEKIRKNDYLNKYSVQIKDRLKDVKELLRLNEIEINKVKEKIKILDQENTQSLSSKIEDLSISEELLAKYNGDLNHYIEYSVIIKNTSLKYLNSYNESLNKEILNLNEEIKNKKGFIDEDRKLIDIDIIKDLTEKIELIENRLKNRINIYEIRDNIELYLTSLDFQVVKSFNNSDLKFHKVVRIFEPNATSKKDGGKK